MLVVRLSKEAAVRPFFASASAAGMTFALAALAGTATGYSAGQVADRVGPRPAIDAWIVGFALIVLGSSCPGTSTWESRSSCWPRDSGRPLGT